MTSSQLEPLVGDKRDWNIAVIQTLFRQPVGVSPSSKMNIKEGVLIIINDDGAHPFKKDKDDFPLLTKVEMHIEIVHIKSVDYFTEKKIISQKKPMIVVP